MAQTSDHKPAEHKDEHAARPPAQHPAQPAQPAQQAQTRTEKTEKIEKKTETEGPKTPEEAVARTDNPPTPDPTQAEADELKEGRAGPPEERRDQRPADQRGPGYQTR